MKYAAFGINDNPTYSFFAPLTTAMWRRIGYDVLVLCVGDEDSWNESPPMRVIREELDRVGATIAWVDPVAGHRSSTVAQISRLYAWSSTALREHDYLVTSDADMWPLDRRFFEVGENKTDGFAILYANNRTRFPMCYFGAYVATWGAAFGAEKHLPLNGYIDDHLTHILRPGGGAEDAWQHDEEFATGMVQRSVGYPERALFVDRLAGEPPADRIDRASWPDRVDLTGRVDAHLIRPGYTDENWPRLVALLEAACPSMVESARSYRSRYAGAVR